RSRRRRGSRRDRRGRPSAAAGPDRPRHPRRRRRGADGSATRGGDRARDLPDVESPDEGFAGRRRRAGHVPRLRRRRRPVHDRDGRPGDDADASPRRARPAPADRSVGRVGARRGESPRPRGELRPRRTREGVTPPNTPFGQWSCGARRFSFGRYVRRTAGLASLDHRAAAPGHRADRRRLLQRRGRRTPRHLPSHGKGALRCPAAEARCHPAAPNPRGVPGPDRRRPARAKPEVGRGRQRGLTANRACGPVGWQARSAQKDTRNSRRPRLSWRRAAGGAQGEQVGEATAMDTSRASRRIIERPRLTRLMTDSESRVMLLVAPAGYGKTTLAREWLRDREHVWYQATPSSSDVAALALGLANSAIEVLPEASDHVRAHLKVSPDPATAPTLIAGELATAFASWPRGTRLVIDDYQELVGSTAAQCLIELLVSRTSIRFLILSRERPSWITAKKLLYGDAREIGRTELAMTRA